MGALYTIRFIGADGDGTGALYIGAGKILGIDVGGGRYEGTYEEANGRIKGSATLIFPTGGQLVTGQSVAPGAKLPITVDWPSNFATGRPQSVLVQGKRVDVVFEWLGDIP